MSVPAIDVEQLTPEERLQLLEQRWDRLTDKNVPLTQAQREALDQRLDEWKKCCLTTGYSGLPFTTEIRLMYNNRRCNTKLKYAGEPKKILF